MNVLSNRYRRAYCASTLYATYSSGCSSVASIKSHQSGVLRTTVSINHGVMNKIYMEETDVAEAGLCWENF
jgi:hypothetical protein